MEPNRVFDLLYYSWFVKENDLIGGWCVMPLDEPPSEGVAPVADFTTREAATHITTLHNAWLEDMYRRLGNDAEPATLERRYDVLRPYRTKEQLRNNVRRVLEQGLENYARWYAWKYGNDGEHAGPESLDVSVSLLTKQVLEVLGIVSEIEEKAT